MASSSVLCWLLRAFLVALQKGLEVLRQGVMELAVQLVGIQLFDAVTVRMELGAKLCFKGVVIKKLHQFCHKKSPRKTHLSCVCYNTQLKWPCQEEPMKIFAVRLKELRNEKKKTQKEMADFLGLKLRAYQYYEGATHYPEVPNLLKLADFFEVSTDYLLGRSNEREMKP